jgi:glycosyltransferase involved in cell wall biosynthesis
MIHGSAVAPSEQNTLSIVIPTYNRPNQLVKSLKVLIPQCSQSNCKIIILDNASPLPISDLIQQHFPDYAELISVTRNITNIGGNANIISCFSACQTEWMWLLGDDDLPTADSISIITKHISEAQKHTIFINFSINKWCNHENTLIESYDEMLKRFSDPAVVGNCLCISASVWRRSNFKEVIKIGFQHTTTCAPHLIMLMHQIKAGKQLSLSQSSIISEKDIPQESYSKIMVSTGIYQILDVNHLRHARLYNAVNALADCFLINSYGEVAQILTESSKHDLKYWIYFFSKVLYFHNSLSVKLRYFIFLLMTIFSTFSLTRFFLMKQLSNRKRSKIFTSIYDRA